MMKETWIIGCGGSNADGVGFTKVFGNKDDVKGILISLVNEARQDDEFNWSSGTKHIDEIEERPTGSLYAYACFPDYHIDWEALPYNDIYKFGE